MISVLCWVTDASRISTFISFVNFSNGDREVIVHFICDVMLNFVESSSTPLTISALSEHPELTGEKTTLFG